MFAAWPTPELHLYMDASNQGLAVLNPAARQFIHFQFDQEEQDMIHEEPNQRGFTINVREQMSIALAAMVWDPSWRSRFAGSVGQVWCWVDNTTAVATSNKLSSKNGLSQELNRRIGFAEAVHGFRVRCIHLPGKVNKMADTASRAWSSPFADLWLLMSQNWTQATVPESLRKPYSIHSDTYNSSVWHQAPSSSMIQVGGSGQVDASACSCPHGSPEIRTTTVLSKISAISWHHRLQRGHAVRLHEGHILAVRGMRRLSAPSIARAPASVPLLRALRAGCDLAITHDRVLWGAAIVGFFYLLRSSEYLHVNGSVAATALQFQDVLLYDIQGRRTDTPERVSRVDLRLRGSKTDQEGRTMTMSHSRSGSDWLCPVLAVLDLVSHAASMGLSQTSPLCSVGGGRCVKASTLNHRLRVAASKCGIEPQRMGTHSLRVGGASAIMAAGVDRQMLKQVGRWRSDAMDRYTRLSDDATRSLASRMAPKRQRLLESVPPTLGSASSPTTRQEAQPRSNQASTRLRCTPPPL